MGFLFIGSEMVAGGDLAALASWVSLSPRRIRNGLYAYLNGMYGLWGAGPEHLV